MTMRMITLIASATLFVAPVAANAATPLEKETAVWQAFKDRHADAFKSMMGPGYVGLYDDGIHSVDSELQALKNSRIQSFKIADLNSHAIDKGEDMLMTYTVDVKGSLGKQDISGPCRVASLWHKTGNKWLMVYHTEIKAK
jgi:hypothetical protein